LKNNYAFFKYSKIWKHLCGPPKTSNGDACGPRVASLHAWSKPMISTYLKNVTTINSKQCENIPQGLCYIWAQTLSQGNYLVDAKIELKPDFSICICKCRRLHLVYLQIHYLKLIIFSGLGIGLKCLKK
jgi:hypothetical protein